MTIQIKPGDWFDTGPSRVHCSTGWPKLCVSISKSGLQYRATMVAIDAVKKEFDNKQKDLRSKHEQLFISGANAPIPKEIDFGF